MTDTFEALRRLTITVESDREPASSLINSFLRWGSFTAKQENYVRVIISRNQPKAQPLTVNAKGLFDMFTLAGTKLKKPVIRLLTADRAIWSIKRAPSNGINEGSLYVYEGEGQGREYAGKIGPDGAVRAGYEYRSKAELLNSAVAAFAADPAKAAKAYGTITSSCCFCGIRLDAGESTDRGYGPICAKNYGLPYTATKKSLKARKATMDVTGKVTPETAAEPSPLDPNDEIPW